jgi:hypothetical protein
MLAQLYEKFYCWFILEDVFQWANFQKQNEKKYYTHKMKCPCEI